MNGIVNRLLRYWTVLSTFQMPLVIWIFETPHDKTNKMTCASIEDSDQPGHPPSLISLGCVLNGKLRTQDFYMRTAKTLTKADLCLCLAHRSFCWFCHEAAHLTGYLLRIGYFLYWYCMKKCYNLNVADNIILLSIYLYVF